MYTMSCICVYLTVQVHFLTVDSSMTGNPLHVIVFKLNKWLRRKIFALNDTYHCKYEFENIQMRGLDTLKVPLPHLSLSSASY